MKKYLSAIFLIASTANAASFDYECKRISGDEFDPVTLTISKNGNSISVAIDGEFGHGKAIGKLDKTYKPRTNKDSERFILTDDLPGYEYRPAFIVPRAMIKGTQRGYVKTQARGEGYYATTLACTLQ